MNCFTIAMFTSGHFLSVVSSVQCRYCGHTKHYMYIALCKMTVKWKFWSNGTTTKLATKPYDMVTKN